MRYSDTIAEPNLLVARENFREHHQHYEGYGDPVLPETQLTRGEAKVAAYLLEALTDRNNQIAHQLHDELDAMAENNDTAAQEQVITVHNNFAREIRRTIKEVAEDNPQIQYSLAQVPASIVKAARQMHYGPEAYELNSTMPTPVIPADLDLSQATQDIQAAVTAIDGITAGKRERAEQLTAEWQRMQARKQTALADQNPSEPPMAPAKEILAAQASSKFLDKYPLLENPLATLDPHINSGEIRQFFDSQNEVTQPMIPKQD